MNILASTNAMPLSQPPPQYFNVDGVSTQDIPTPMGTQLANAELETAS